MRNWAMLAIALLAPAPAGSVPASAPAQLTRAEAERMSTAELAGRLLAPDLATRIRSHEVAGVTAWFPREPLRSIRFYEAPQLRGRLCRRAVTYVGLKPVASPPPQSDGRDVLVFPETRLAQVQIGIVPTCHAAGQSDLAFVQPATDEAGASAALLWIADLQKQPAAKQFRAVRVTCSSELKPNACWRGARATLARLPLRRAAIMDRLIPEIHGKQGWNLAVAPTGLGQAYWKVTIDTRPTARAVHIEWKFPDPF